MPLLKTSFVSKTTLFLASIILSMSAMALDFSQTQLLANKGVPEAQFDLGEMYRDGEGVRQDHAKAFEWYQKADNQGFAEAQSNLGVMYFSGKGVRQDKTRAKELISQSCANGHQISCDSYQRFN